METFIRRNSKRERMERAYDFMDCFSDPAEASTVYPLTIGRVFGSCIRDDRSVVTSLWLWKTTFTNCPLPNREHPNRLPHRINGLTIKYQFKIRRMELELVTSLVFVGAVVLVWKFATGDWNVAAAFGSLCVALMALGHQRSRSQEEITVKNTKIDWNGSLLTPFNYFQSWMSPPSRNITRVASSFDHF